MEGHSQEPTAELALGQVAADLDSHLRHRGTGGGGAWERFRLKALHLVGRGAVLGSFSTAITSPPVPSSKLRYTGLKSIPGAQTQT